MITVAETCPVLDAVLDESSANQALFQKPGSPAMEPLVPMWYGVYLKLARPG